MEFNQIELRRETIFKDAVLSAAEAHSMEIIAAAQRESAQKIAQAQALCEEADHDVIAAGLVRDTEKEHSAALQGARADLLRHRADLVDELFAEVEKELAAFTQSGDYPKWLAARAEKHADLAKKGAALTVYLRAADMAHQKAVEKALPGCTVKEDATIRLGGLKVSDGRVLYNETMSAALDAERENFYRTSGLSL